jgi:N-acetylmuramoyl-L-alanine amidase
MAELRLPGALQPGLGLHRGMAGEGGGPACPAGCAYPARVRGRGAARIAGGLLRRWTSLAVLLAFYLGASEAQVLSSRIWPARDYTRLTLESREAIEYTIFSIKDPERLVIDLETNDITAALAELNGKVAADDPYVQGLRVARNRPGVVRLVLDLKAEVKPQIFTLSPIADYGHRLVLDLHPLVAIDPLVQLLQESEQSRPAAKPGVARIATIVIDAGHGGEDPGAIGRRGSREKDITLTIAKRLKALVDAEPNMRALLTRDGDYFLPLNSRVEKARKVRADLFVSIHADAFTRPNVRGSSVFALSDKRATSELARALAKKENESDLIGGVALNVKDDHVRRTIMDLSQSATIDYSLRLGSSVLKQLGGINELHKPRVEQASFAVLTAHDVPSILVETAFISNPQEEKRLNDHGYQDKLARAILEGIREYVAKHPPRPLGPVTLGRLAPRT